MMVIMGMTVTMMMIRRRKMITKAGAMRESVDILTAPRRETRRSNQGTVAAKPTEDFNLDLNFKMTAHDLCCYRVERYQNLHVNRLRPILVRNSTMLNILGGESWMRNSFLQRRKEKKLSNLSEDTFGLITFGPRMSMTT